ncbi:MAG: hypothetical protein WKF61_03245 [Luteimonas sp.]
MHPFRFDDCLFDGGNGEPDMPKTNDWFFRRNGLSLMLLAFVIP